ncbi:hypothetical protein LIER_18545 [Lithospermum erythrorhizon]|uniref:Uncharacterized protein n=1 Tax=Lithospermum erythrorhizon TaxID=34254 RepID=A0AAV3QHI6_LITER
MMVKNSVDQRKVFDNKWRKGDREDSRYMVKCEYCDSKGHSKDKCFKLHGFPEWWNTRNSQRNRFPNSRNMANMMVTPLESTDTTYLSSMMQTMQLMQKEIEKIKGAGDLVRMLLTESTWCNLKILQIIETGATNHMSCSENLFLRISDILYSSPDSLPDDFVGMSSYVPDFHYNLLSISKCILQSQVFFVFHPEFCFLQDQQSSRVVGIGRHYKGFFLLDQHSFNIVIFISYL